MNAMEYKGFKAQIMEAPKLTGDCMHGLPPGNPVEVYPSDVFLKYPKQWMKNSSTFVVPVRPNFGLWFNFTDNPEMNTAVLPTIKGCNPITGLQTSGFHLERYEDKCPKHGCKFLADLFCPECNYKWPSRNYISAPAILWWDGWFNAKDGTVRQFFFSEEELRDVATHFIGKEQTVPAFGFAFYTPKVSRPEPSLKRQFFNKQSSSGSWISSSYHNELGGSCKLYGSSLNGSWVGEGFKGLDVDYSSTDLMNKHIVSTNSASFSDLACHEAAPSKQLNNVYTCSASSAAAAASASASAELPVKLGKRISHSFSKTLKKSSPISTEGLISEDMSHERSAKKEVKEVSVGAGAKIRQDLPNDPYPLDSWKDTPDASMTIYFVFQEKFEELKAGGLRDFSGVKEGMLAGVPVG